MGLTDAHSLPSGHFLSKYTTEDFILDEVDLMTEWQTRLLCQERIEVTKELFPVISKNQNTLKSFLYLHTSRLSGLCMWKKSYFKLSKESEYLWQK